MGPPGPALVVLTTRAFQRAFFTSFFFGSKLLSRGEGVLEYRLGPSPRSIDRGSASDVFSGGPDAGDLILLVYLSLNHVATEVQASKCGDRQSAFAHVRRDATAGPSGHKSRSQGDSADTYPRVTSSPRGHTTGTLWIPSSPPRKLPGVFNGIQAYSSLS
jgi:hypothetical protein